MDQLQINAKVESTLTTTIVSQGLLTDSGHYSLTANAANGYVGTSRIASVNGIATDLTIAGNGTTSIRQSGSTIYVDTEIDNETKLRSINQLTGNITIAAQGDIVLERNLSSNTLTISVNALATASNAVTTLANLYVTDNTIGVTDTDKILTLLAQGTGTVNLNNVAITGSNITVPGQDMVLSYGEPSLTFESTTNVLVQDANGYISVNADNKLKTQTRILNANAVTIANTANTAITANTATVANTATTTLNWGNIPANNTTLKITNSNIAVAANTKIEFANAANIKLTGLPSDGVQRVIYAAADNQLQLATVAEYSSLIGSTGSAQDIGNYTQAATIPVGAMALGVSVNQQTINGRVNTSQEVVNYRVGSTLTTGSTVATEPVQLNQMTSRTSNMPVTSVVKLAAAKLNSKNYWVIFDKAKVLYGDNKDRLDRTVAAYTIASGEEIVDGIVLNDGRLAVVLLINGIYSLAVSSAAFTATNNTWQKYQLPYRSADGKTAKFTPMAIAADSNNNIVLAGSNQTLTSKTTTTSSGPVIFPNSPSESYSGTTNLTGTSFNSYVAGTTTTTTYPNATTKIVTEIATIRTITSSKDRYGNPIYSWQRRETTKTYYGYQSTTTTTTYTVDSATNPAIFEFNPTANYDVTTVNGITGTHGLTLAYQATAEVLGQYRGLIVVDNKFIAIPQKQAIYSQDLKLAIKNPAWTEVNAGKVLLYTIKYQPQILAVAGGTTILFYAHTKTGSTTSEQGKIVRTTTIPTNSSLGTFNDSTINAALDIKSIVYNNVTDNSFYLALNDTDLILSTAGTNWTSVYRTDRVYTHIAVIDSEVLLLDATGAYSVTGLITPLDVPPTILNNRQLMLSTTTNPSHPAATGTYSCIGGPIDNRIFLWIRTN